MKSCLSDSEFFSSVAVDAVVFLNSYHSSLDFCSFASRQRRGNIDYFTILVNVCFSVFNKKMSMIVNFMNVISKIFIKNIE